MPFLEFRYKYPDYIGNQTSDRRQSAVRISPLVHGREEAEVLSAAVEVDEYGSQELGD